MTVNKINLGCKFIALLMLLTVIFNWKGIYIFFNNPLPIGWYVIISIVFLLFFLLNVVSAVGLFWSKHWGFTLSYIAIVFSTLFFGSCYIPHLPRLFPAHERPYIAILVNLILIAVIATLHYLSRRKPAATA